MPLRQIRDWLATLFMPTITPNTFLILQKHFHTLENVFAADQLKLQTFGLTLDQVAKLKQPDWRPVEQAMQWAEQKDHHIVSWQCASYPEQLRNISQPPLVLFVRGNLAALQQPQIAIVGSRTASTIGKENAIHFAYYLARAGLTVTSGLARGIDGAAHYGALKAQGMTIGVAGTGLFHSYPVQHRKLNDEICANNGAVISEFPLTTGPLAYNFPRRNRIISGLSLGVLVVEAALKSGSMSTVRHALEQGREVFALPGSIHHPLSHGCHYLIRQGAKLVETVQDILEEFSQFQLSISIPAKHTIEQNISKKYEQLLKHIEYEITSIDMIICRSGLTAGEVSSILLLLEIYGYIKSVAGGYVRVTPDNELD